MFTFAHELAHIFLGQSGISNINMNYYFEEQSSIEMWCNYVAAEFLLPIDELKSVYKSDSTIYDNINIISNLYNVSRLVTILRLHTANIISNEMLHHLYGLEISKVKKTKSGSGCDFFDSLCTRSSKRFTKALLASTLEGGTLFNDACKLLAIQKVNHIYTLSKRLGIMS